jgi:SAM-dependent methyltransferase
MNKSKLKTFAAAMRRDLMDAVRAKVDYVLSHDIESLPPKYYDHRDKITTLAKLVESSGKEEVVERVAYTWFNRLIALRFMDAAGINEIAIVSPIEDATLPQIYNEVRAGNTPDELKFDKQKFFDLIDGKIQSADPENEAYAMLFIASCNAWHEHLPFMFEKIADYTELLIPDDLLGASSLRVRVVDVLESDDCSDVEVIGWLYQFYIDEKKAIVDNNVKLGKKVQTQEIPAKTQLFTPHWIVRYLVENSLGRIWMTSRPTSKLVEHMPYYVEYNDATAPITVSSVEEITLLDPCCGSGHMLTYAYDLLEKIYEEEGYPKSDIPGFILEKNLFGCDLDERAASLAAFALTMKARLSHRRFFRKAVRPNIIELQPYDDDRFKHIKDLGSLIRLKPSTTKIDVGVFAYSNREFSLQERILGGDFHCVVTNPPYLGKGMNPFLSDYVKKNFPDSKTDLFACFMERGMEMTKPGGYMAMIVMQSWMFLSSYENVRTRLLQDYELNTLAHLGNMVMGIAFGTSAFVFHNIKPTKDSSGIYFKIELEDLDEDREIKGLR